MASNNNLQESLCTKTLHSSSDPNNEITPPSAPSDELPEDIRTTLVLARKALIRWDNLTLADLAITRIDAALGGKK